MGGTVCLKWVVSRRNLHVVSIADDKSDWIAMTCGVPKAQFLDLCCLIYTYAFPASVYRYHVSCHADVALHSFVTQ